MQVPTADTYPLCPGHKIYIYIMHNKHAIIIIVVTCSYVELLTCIMLLLCMFTKFININCVRVFVIKLGQRLGTLIDITSGGVEGGGGVGLAKKKPVEQAAYSRLLKSMVTFDVTSSRYSRPWAKRGADSDTGSPCFLRRRRHFKRPQQSVPLR